jgi:hypothetical protein
MNQKNYREKLSLSPVQYDDIDLKNISNRLAKLKMALRRRNL